MWLGSCCARCSPQEGPCQRRRGTGAAGVALKLNCTCIYMECPICYEKCHKTCTLVCRHRFCMSCVREWWIKSECPTCPICRQNLYFRGMRHVTPEWSDEPDDEVWESMCTFLLRVKSHFGIPWIRLVEPQTRQDFTLTVAVCSEFPATWFPPPLPRPKNPLGRKGPRGRRSNWLEE